jgi:flagellar P-ring protein precursor FlgI
MKRSNCQIFCLVFVLVLVLSNGQTRLSWGARLKDIASLKGVRTNQLIGYGLVVGLQGTGDGDSTEFTVQSLINMLERVGVHVRADDVKVKNVAAVMVTAALPPFARVGNQLDVLISSIGDATSLQGGTLLLTSLKGIDGNVYALAQGPITIGGFVVQGKAEGGVQKNHPTVGKIPNGATIEREIPFRLRNIEDLIITLHDPDFTTAQRVSKAVNTVFTEQVAFAEDAGTIKLKLDETAKENLVGLVASLEQIEVEPDNKAKIVVSARTGTIVMGEHVRVSSVAIAHGNISVEIKENQNVSQPLPFSRTGETVVTRDSEVNVTEDQGDLILMPQGTSLAELVDALNAIGVSPRDLIQIFLAIKEAGALQAELEII